MPGTVITLPEARDRLMSAAGQFNAAAARFITATLGKRTWPREEEDIIATTDLIRAADDYLAMVKNESPAAQEGLADTAVMASALRRAAFLVMVDINPDQAWFWTEEWQAGEREVDANIAAGRVQHFDSEEELDAFLRGLRADLADV